jgi:hypothetical protein
LFYTETEPPLDLLGGCYKMSDKLAEIRGFAARNDLLLSGHALASVELGELDVDDIQFALLTATAIYKRERDEKGDAVDGYKYTIIGRACGGLPIYTCGKIVEWLDGRTYFLITAHPHKEAESHETG